MLERDRIIEIIAAVSAVVLMLAAMYWIGTTYGSADAGGLEAEGGELLVGAIIGFIVLLLFVGIGLAFALNDPEDGLEDEEAETEVDNQNAL